VQLLFLERHPSMFQSAGENGGHVIGQATGNAKTFFAPQRESAPT
jgi:hypothetical protein